MAVFNTSLGKKTRVKSQRKPAFALLVRAARPAYNVPIVLNGVSVLPVTLEEVADTCGLDLSNRKVEQSARRIARLWERGLQNGQTFLAFLRNPAVPLGVREDAAVELWRDFSSAWRDCSEEDRALLAANSDQVNRRTFTRFYGPGLLRWLDDRPRSIGRMDEYLTTGNG